MRSPPHGSSHCREEAGFLPVLDRILLAHVLAPKLKFGRNPPVGWWAQEPPDGRNGGPFWGARAHCGALGGSYSRVSLASGASLVEGHGDAELVLGGTQGFVPPRSGRGECISAGPLRKVLSHKHFTTAVSAARESAAQLLAGCCSGRGAVGWVGLVTAIRGKGAFVRKLSQWRKLCPNSLWWTCSSRSPQQSPPLRPRRATSFVTLIVGNLPTRRIRSFSSAWRFNERCWRNTRSEKRKERQARLARNAFAKVGFPDCAFCIEQISEIKEAVPDMTDEQVKEALDHCNGNETDTLGEQ